MTKALCYFWAEPYRIAFLVSGRFLPDIDFLRDFEYYDRWRGVLRGGWTRIITIGLSKLERLPDSLWRKWARPKNGCFTSGVNEFCVRNVNGTAFHRS
jgi:hypothetical protein